MLQFAIVGAGPYGLSVAAHLRKRGVSFRIFGRPMDSWLARMPKGMMLKSDGFASDIYDPNGEFSLKRFCSEQGIEYADIGIPVRLETFCSYGLAFQDRMVPELEQKMISKIERTPEGFVLHLEDGEVFAARKVVLAVGITHFAYVPPELAHLSSEFVSHSSVHHDLEKWRGRKVVVLGAGSSALDLAGLLHENGTEVQLVCRATSLNFHNAPSGKPRSLWKRIRHPQSGLGPGMRSRFYANAPGVFYHLPAGIRTHIVRTTLGPSGGWFIREKVMGKVSLLLGHTLEKAEMDGGQVCLSLRDQNGNAREVETEHVIAATGYRVNMERLVFLSEGIRSEIKTVAGSPALSRGFESSVPGLYFVGVAAANSFGPVMRFAFGAGFAAKTVTEALIKAHAERTMPVSASSIATAAK
jgi:thioredoxin reductase